MKTTVLFILAALLALPGLAQTNFRSITYDEAIAAAKAENKLVFMDFYTDWCGPCKRMAREVFPQKKVGDYMNEKFVCIKLNAEKEGKELADLYKIEAYPTFIAIDADKNIVLTKVGGGNADDFIADIDRMLDPDRTPERMKARYEGGERTPKLIASYAAYLKTEAFNQRDKFADLIGQANRMIHDYFNGLTDAEKLSPENLFVYTEYAMAINDEITQYMIAHRNEFDEASQKTLIPIIDRLYATEIGNYLGAKIPYDATAYNALKQQINELGLNKDKQYDPCFRLIECYAQGDIKAYLTLCEKEYPMLNDVMKNALIANFGNLFKEQDEAIRQQASKFLRCRLENMDTNDMMFAVYQIIELESKK